MDSIDYSLGEFECRSQGWKGFGSLTFDPDLGGTLKLFRPKSNNSAVSDFRQKGNKIELRSDNSLYEITGQIEGRKNVKLMNCLSHSLLPIVFPNEDVKQFSFNSLFVGNGNGAIPSEFDAVEIRLRHQDEWVGAPSEDLISAGEWVSLAENPSHAVQISRPEPETFRICLPEYNLIMTRFYNVSGSFGQMPRFSSEPSSSLRIEYEKPTSLSEIPEVVNHISSLISISLQNAIPLTGVNLFKEERKIQWFGWLPEVRGNSVRRVNRLHSFDNLEKDDVKKWLEKVSPLSGAVNLLLRHFYQDGTSYIDTSFGDVYRAMETIVIHFSNINDSKSGLNKKLLNFLLHEVRRYYVIDPEISSKKEWRDFIVRTRNEELTHKRVEQKRERAGTILEDDKLFYATQSLRQLTIIYLLLKCGINENFIRNLYEYRGVLFNHLQKSDPEKAPQE